MERPRATLSATQSEQLRREREKLRVMKATREARDRSPVRHSRHAPSARPGQGLKSIPSTQSKSQPQSKSTVQSKPPAAKSKQPSPKSASNPMAPPSSKAQPGVSSRSREVQSGWTDGKTTLTYLSKPPSGTHAILDIVIATGNSAL